MGGQSLESEQVHNIDIVIANANSCLLRLDPDEQQPLPRARRRTASSARSYIVLQRNELSLVPVFTSGLPFPHRATSAVTELGSLCRENKSGACAVGARRVPAALSGARLGSTRLRTGYYRYRLAATVGSRTFPSSSQLPRAWSNFSFRCFLQRRGCTPWCVTLRWINPPIGDTSREVSGRAGRGVTHI